MDKRILKFSLDNNDNIVVEQIEITYLLNTYNFVSKSCFSKCCIFRNQTTANLSTKYNKCKKFTKNCCVITQLN